MHTTQKFTEIVDFVDDIVILEGGNACMIIEITASNFALLSKREQDIRIFSYAGLLIHSLFLFKFLSVINAWISQSIHELDDIIKTTPKIRSLNNICMNTMQLCSGNGYC